MNHRVAARLRTSVFGLLALLVGLGALTGAPADALSEPSQDPEVVEVVDECGSPGQDTRRLTITLGPGYLYDVTVNGASATPTGGGQFDTRELTEPVAFALDLLAGSTTQHDLVQVRHGQLLLYEATVNTGECYELKGTALSITAPASVLYGDSITVSGRLSAGASDVSGASVVVERRFVGSAAWTFHGSAVTAEDGRFSVSAKPSRDTEYRLRFTGDTRYAASTSSVRKVTVLQHETTLSISRSASTINYGDQVTISGYLRTMSGTSVAGESVSLQRRFVGTTTWTTHASATTSSTGRVSFSTAPSRHTEYRLRHSATTGYGASTSSVVKVSVRPVLTFSASQTKALLGRTTTIKGKISPSYSGQTISLQRLQSGTWRTLASMKPSTTGTYSFPVKPTSTGSWTYRVHVPATTRHLSVTSATVKITRYKAVISSINYDAPGDDRYNLNGEYAVIKNTGSVTVNLKDWVLDADDGQRRALPSYSLSPGVTVRVHTGSGTNTTGHLYLGYKAPIWNNDGDTGRLYDPNGVRASTYSY